MKKTRRQFVLYAVLAVFASLVILLGIINILTFTMAANDADGLTETITSDAAGNTGPNQGGKNKPGANPGQAGTNNGWNNQGTDPGHFGPFGQGSPEIMNSLRYFTIALDKNDRATVINYSISAVTEEEAIEWAKSLKKESTGWTRINYRYRVYKRDGVTYVTVIDQGRELLPAYRILIFSVCGTLLGTLLSFVILRLVSKRLFAPLEEADRKQKKFIAAAEQEFKLPLTVINADIELIERETGSTEQTRSVHRQVNKMTTLVRNLGSLNVFEEGAEKGTEFDIGETLKRVIKMNRERLEQTGIALEENIASAKIKGDEAAFEKAFGEIIENLLKYADSKAVFSLETANGRIRLSISNDTGLSDGEYNQVFDRFVTLENAVPGSAGLGFASVKNVIDSHNGRISAKVENNMFVLNIDL